MEKKFLDWFDRQVEINEDQIAHHASLYKMLNNVDPPPPPPPPPPERKDTPWWPNRMNTAGVTAFPLTIREQPYIRKLIPHIQSHGYNTLSVGAQAWSEAQGNKVPMLPSGPIGNAEWAENLDRMLRTTAEFENCWVQLIPTFGYKQYDTDPDGMEYAWHLEHSKKIYEIIKAGDYKHVFISVMNEFKHPLTDDDLGDTDIARLADWWAMRGFYTSTDHGGREKDVNGDRVWKAYYPEAWQPFTHYNFHTPRNPHPSLHQFQKATARWPGKLLLYNETLCYGSVFDTEKYERLVGAFTMSNRGRGSDDDRKWPIRDIKHNITQAGKNSRFFFHSIWLGIRGGLDTPLGWMPQY